MRLPFFHRGCLPDFIVGDNSTSLFDLAHTLQIHNPVKLIEDSPITTIALGRSPSGGGSLVNVTLHSHPADKMVYMLRKEAARDVYDLGSRTTEGDLLDIGGHIGLTALLFHRLHPDAHVHVFEPAPLNFFYLAYNAVQNGVDGRRVHLYNRGLSRDGSPFLIEYSPDDTTSTRRASLGHSWGKLDKSYHTVRSFGMKQLRSCLPLDDVGLVKLDCEGCEFDLVPSDSQFFSARERRVVGEFHGWHVRQPGHIGNVSHRLVRTVRTLLCRRERQREDRIVWLSEPPKRRPEPRVSC